MISAEHTIEIDAKPEDAFNCVTDFESYPKFLPEIEAAKVMKKTAKSVTAAFTMNLMQRVNYTLKFQTSGRDKIPWDFVEGDSIIKENKGYWLIEGKKGGKTSLTYHVDLSFNMWIPESVVKSLIADHLPNMLEKFKTRIEEGV
jgi:ribosome-associated toxin RatA of RatAB toxin-antitoxin module